MKRINGNPSPLVGEDSLPQAARVGVNASANAELGIESTPRTPPHQGEGRVRCLALLPLLLLAACAEQVAAGVAPAAPGFLHGLWHGFIFPVAWVLSLFVDDIAIYAVPNNGGWYDFGYFLGIVVFGVGARKSQVVYRDRVVERRVEP